MVVNLIAFVVICLYSWGTVNLGLAFFMILGLQTLFLALSSVTYYLSVLSACMRTIAEKMSEEESPEN